MSRRKIFGGLSRGSWNWRFEGARSANFQSRGGVLPLGGQPPALVLHGENSAVQLHRLRRLIVCLRFLQFRRQLREPLLLFVNLFLDRLDALLLLTPEFRRRLARLGRRLLLLAGQKNPFACLGLPMSSSTGSLSCRFLE